MSDETVMGDWADGMCWFGRFDQEPACHKAGVWAWPDAPPPYDVLVKEMRWCNEHKHENDTRIG